MCVTARRDGWIVVRGEVLSATEVTSTLIVRDIWVTDGRRFDAGICRLYETEREAKDALLAKYKGWLTSDDEVIADHHRALARTEEERVKTKEKIAELEAELG